MVTINTDLVSYYRERAGEYEEIYQKPERQADLETAATLLRDHFHNKNIIEIGCGTGYWTQKIASAAASILSTDINETVIDIARSKNYVRSNVQFRQSDFFKPIETKKYESLFGGFVWSHIAIRDIPAFLRRIGEYVIPGGTIVFIDNNYVAGSNTPVSTTDADGNRFQKRKLNDGSEYLVLKNFPTEDFARKQLEGNAAGIKWISLQ